MSLVQPILAYLTLAMAIGYLVFKFFVPKAILSKNKKNQKVCGQDECGCH